MTALRMALVYHCAVQHAYENVRVGLDSDPWWGEYCRVSAVLKRLKEIA